jgi:uncharacterized protein (TIGR00730 family)
MFGDKKKPKDLHVEVVDMHCRIMTDLLGDPGDNSVQSWRVFRIMSEFVGGFELLRKYGTAATFFGSARYDVGHPVYEASKKLAGLLAQSGFTIITGGGGGVMSAANNGAFEAGGESVGLNIKLPTEQKPNAYLTDVMEFDFFFSRKVMLSFASEVYVYFPGGYGTLDEFFELITLIQTKKISHVPIVLVDGKFWNPLIDFIKQTILADYKAIDEIDLELFHVVDSVEEAYAYITTHVDPCSPRQI